MAEDRNIPLLLQAHQNRQVVVLTVPVEGEVADDGGRDSRADLRVTIDVQRFNRPDECCWKSAMIWLPFLIAALISLSFAIFLLLSGDGPNV